MSYDHHHRIYLGRLPYGTRERDIEKFLQGSGRVRDINLKNGFGFVTFDDPRDARDAVSDCNNRELLGERILVEACRGSSSRGYSGGPRQTKGRDKLKRGEFWLKQYDMNDKADVNMAKTENNNSRENNCQIRGSSRVSRTRDSVTRQPRDIGTCLNTLDYLKAVLQSTMHETEKQNEYVSQIERELAKEIERAHEAEQKIKSQEEEIRRLLEINQTLNERVKQKDSRISEIEDVLQLSDCNTENIVRRSGSQKERKMGSVCVELSEDLTRETILDISDTQC